MPFAIKRHKFASWWVPEWATQVFSLLCDDNNTRRSKRSGLKRPQGLIAQPHLSRFQRIGPQVPCCQQHRSGWSEESIVVLRTERSNGTEERVAEAGCDHATTQSLALGPWPLAGCGQPPVPFQVLVLVQRREIPPPRDPATMPGY